MSLKFFLIFFSILIGSTLLIISVASGPQILLLFSSDSISGEIETCDSVNTDYGMKYSYSGHFQLKNTPYEFHNDLVGGKRFKIGQQVTVLYNPKDPKENVIDSFGDKYSSVYGISLMMVLLAIIFVIYRRVNRSNKK